MRAREKVKGKASPIQSSRIGSVLVCVRRNVQHRELKLPQSTRFALITAVMVAVPTAGPSGYPLGPSPLLSKNIESHEEPPERHRAQGVPPTIGFALGANTAGKERVKGKASWMQSSRIRSALVRLRRNAHNRELKVPESTRFLLNAVLVVAVLNCGPTGCPVSSPPLSSQDIQSHEEPPESHRAQDVPPTISLALGANTESKERVTGKASWIQSSRVGSALVRVHRNAQHLEPKLLESKRFVLNTSVIVSVSSCELTGCPVSAHPLSSRNIHLHEKSHTNQRARGETPFISLPLGTNREGRERVKVKASWIQSSRIGSALVCVRRNVQHRELKLPKSTRFALITVAMVAVPTGGPTGCLVSPPPLYSQNIQSHEKAPVSHRVRGETPTMGFALGANGEGKERVEGKGSRIRSS